MNDLLYLSRADVEQVGPTMPEIIAALEQAFRAKGAGEVEMPPKPGIHPLPDAFIHAMPAFIRSTGAAGIKWVSGFPQNQERGLPYIHGLLILNDAQTGVPLSVMDCTWITAQRTGAATAVAAKHLARPDSRTVGILACGVQGRSNLEALACCFDLEHVYAYDVHDDVARRFAAEMSNRLQVTIDVVGSAEQATRERDLVVTSGPILKQPQPTIQMDWLARGAFASPVDFDSYWTPEALAQIDILVTDDLTQFRYYREAGYFQQTPEPRCDLGDLAVGRARGRQDDRQRTMAINLGMALEDMATAPLIYARAVEAGVGQRLPL